MGCRFQELLFCDIAVLLTFVKNGGLENGGLENVCCNALWYCLWNTGAIVCVISMDLSIGARGVFPAPT